jgi:hypothetical protein
MNHHDTSNVNKMAVSATLHCLSGCAIGEILGLIIGTAFSWSTLLTTLLAIVLAFIFGFSLSTLPLVKGGARFWTALTVVIAADTLSITTMEIVDTIVMVTIPGALNAGLLNGMFWISLVLSLTAAFFAALPVNRYLLSRGKGHALLMKHHNHS